MGEAQVDQNQLDQIGSYVRSHIGQWLREQNILPFPERERGLDREILDRIITVEQQLKFQNEKIEMMMVQSDKRFESMDKRFESMDKRFESMDKRFTDMQLYMDKRFEASQKNMSQSFNRVYGLLTIIFAGMLSGFVTLIVKLV